MGPGISACPPGRSPIWHCPSIKPAFRVTDIYSTLQAQAQLLFHSNHGNWATQCYRSRKSFGSGQYARALPWCKASVPQIRREPHRTDSNPLPRPSTRETLCQLPLRNRSLWLSNLGFTSDGKVPSTVLGCTVVQTGQLIPYRALSALTVVYQKYRLMATACTLLNRSMVPFADSFCRAQVWTPNGAFLESLTPGTEGEALRLSIAGQCIP
jgi:hypothetical protein